MTSTGITLKRSDELLCQVEPIVSAVRARIVALFPDAELHHIGATAVAGSLTKGDIDILYRVPQSEFDGVRDLLALHFITKQRVNWTADFASFGDEATYSMPVGIQLVAKDSVSDFFLYQRDYFLAHPEATEEYNMIKVAHAGEPPERYWKAKDAFLAKVVALWSKSKNQPPNKSTDPALASVTSPAEQEPRPR
jgi:GrpB-like predicted nucleotidyltransferase (UPF0157 family)